MIIFSPISFLYPLAELEALGRKDIFVITSFLIFSFINYKNLNSTIYSFFVFFGISTLIHEITMFYIFHYFFIIYIKNKFIFNEILKKKFYFFILIFLFILLYLNLYQHNLVRVEDIINSYNLYGDFTTQSGSFSHLSVPIGEVFFKTFNNVNLVSIIRYGLVYLINIIPFIFFIKINNFTKNKYLTSLNIFILIILLSLPLYLLILDWGRVTYINYNFFIIVLLSLFRLNLVNKEYLSFKIKSLKKKFKIFIFIIICLSFSPKILISDDLASFPLYRSIAKLAKKAIYLQNEFN